MLGIAYNNKRGIIDDVVFNRNNNRSRIGRNCDIHPTAIIETGAIIGDNVQIGAFSFIGKHVKIGNNCTIKPHAVIEGYTTMGQGNKVFSFATIGQIPQDLKYNGELSQILIGNNNSIREHCTIHPGTAGDSLITRIGDNNLLMVNVHVAHDCVIENNCVLANNSTLAGHVKLGNHCIIGGHSAIHQKVILGSYSILGGMSGLGKDLIPFGTAFATIGREATLQGLNIVGLKRHNFDRHDIYNAIHYYDEVFNNHDESTLITRATETQTKYPHNPIINDISKFLQTFGNSRRFCTASESK